MRVVIVERRSPEPEVVATVPRYIAEAAKALWLGGQKIGALRLIRGETDFGLRDSKDVLEQIVNDPKVYAGFAPERMKP
jgi:ribosomal protein L7/L12